VIADPAAAPQPGNEACVCQLTEPLGLRQPTVSHHLKVLLQADLVEREQRGNTSPSVESNGDCAGHDQERNAVRDDERQVVTRNAVGNPQPEADQKHGEVADRDSLRDRRRMISRICRIGESAMRTAHDAAERPSAVETIEPPS